jgi:hypothetical protein
MPFIYADSSDGVISAGGSSFTAARHATTGTVSNVSEQKNLYAVRASSLNARGGGLTYRYARSFFAFDVTSISSVASVTLVLSGYSSAGIGGIVVMESNAFGNNGGSALAAGDYDGIVNWNGADNMTAARKYSAAPGINHNTWNTNGPNGIRLGSTAENDIINNNYLLVCIVDYTYDYLKAAPIDTSFGTGALANNLGLYFNDIGNTKRPYLDIVTTSGFGHDINGVASASIGEVNTVATASIGKINTVD